MRKRAFHYFYVLYTNTCIKWIKIQKLIENKSRYLCHTKRIWIWFYIYRIKVLKVNDTMITAGKWMLNNRNGCCWEIVLQCFGPLNASMVGPIGQTTQKNWLDFRKAIQLRVIQMVTYFIFDVMFFSFVLSISSILAKKTSTYYILLPEWHIFARGRHSHINMVFQSWFSPQLFSTQLHQSNANYRQKLAFCW